MDTIDAKSQSGMSRRDLLRIVGGVATVNGLGAAMWGALELMVPAATAETWHKSVCRYYRTGCGVLVGMRDGRVTDICGDESAHSVICIKGAMLRELPYVKGRLTKPKIRRDGNLVEATWDEAMALVAQKFQEAIVASGPDAVAAELGIAAPQIREVAFLFAHSQATMSLWTMGINQRTQGVFLNNMLNALPLITGHIGRPGAMPFSFTGQTNACGGVRDTGSLSHLLPAGHTVANEPHRREVEQLWGVPPGTISDKPGLDAVNLFRAMEDGRVRAVPLMCTNPAQSLPAADRYRAGMEKCFLAVAEIFEDSETARLADVLLPAALWIEKEGCTGQGERSGAICRADSCSKTQYVG